MRAERTRSPAEQDALVESALLRLIIDLHPDHLRSAELVGEMSANPRSGGDEDEIERAIDRLLRTGLARTSGEAIAPTHVALRAFELLTA